MSEAEGQRWRGEVDSRLARLELVADEVEAVGAGFGARSTRETGEGDGGEEYPDLDAWVTDYFCAVFTRAFGGEFRWCAQWHEHREAVVRLDALWCSWKALRRDSALGMSTWFHLYLDPQLGVLFSSRGPFAQCSETRHEPASE